MRSFRYLLLVMFFTIPLAAEGLAQDGAVERYDNRAIRLEMHWWRTRFIMNNEAHKTGFMYRNLTTILAGSSAAHDDLRKFSRKQKISYGFQILGYGLAFAAWYAERRDQDDDTRAYVIGNFVSFSIAQIFSWAARNSLNKAIWLYNRDVVAGAVASIGIRDRNTAVLAFRLPF